MIAVTCPQCSAKLNARDDQAGKSVACPKCKTAVRVAASTETAIQAAAETREDRAPARQARKDSLAEAVQPGSMNPKRMRRQLALLIVRQRLRAACARVLGDGTGERIVFSLIVAFIPYCLSFGLAAAFGQSVLVAAILSVGAFAIVAAVLGWLIVRGTDDALQARREQLERDLPAVEAAIAEDRAAREQWHNEPRERPQFQRCPYCTETIPYDARKCKHCGEFVDGSARERRGPSVIHVHHHENRSGALAAILELLFGLFFQTFGVGHIYGGNVGRGLFLLFGYWAFIFINVVLVFVTCGIWGMVAPFLVAAVWFLMLVISPLMAAASVSSR